MSKSNDSTFGKYFQLPNSGLKNYFGRVVAGSDAVITTPFVHDGEDPITILEEWRTHLKPLATEWPTLLEFENDLASKVGPMSVMKPLKDRLSDLDAYYEGITTPSVPISDSALKAVLAEWNAAAPVQVRSQLDTIKNMKLSTNSGSPYFARRLDCIDKTYPVELLERDGEVYQILNAANKGMPGANGIPTVWRCAAVLGWRGQEGGPTIDNVKQRVVWMFPFGVNIRELQVYQPLIETSQQHHLVPAWVSLQDVDNRITRMFDTKNPQDLVVCTDFTKFDQHFGFHLQQGAYFILSNLLHVGNKSKAWLENVFPVKYVIPIAYDWGSIRRGSHGMASGSGGTNADETLVHRALQYEAALEQGSRLNIHSQCLGDDGVITYPGITVQQVVDSYSRHGLEMNESKQYASTEDCTYLRRWYHTRYRKNGVCVGVYSTCRALGRLMYQERYYDPKVWGPKMVALRQLSILENVKYHPLGREFVLWCMKRDKYRLGIDIPGFLANITSIASDAVEVMPDFLGYTRSQMSGGEGIADWWITKLLRSLS